MHHKITYLKVIEMFPLHYLPQNLRCLNCKCSRNANFINYKMIVNSFPSDLFIHSSKFLNQLMKNN